ncbi:uncharacterized protein LOC121725761 [Aricia agestis]|uniref:uncharacterized protein LOC121725761 n=1 Tax=Aricia agestis TaxID=91739 RepID=UPI001C206364|nr:uncharacterized protein LOC121725761 [Aricia agestis]
MEFVDGHIMTEKRKPKIPITASNIPSSDAESPCCTRLLELAGQAQALAGKAQGLFYGCYNERIHEVLCTSLARALILLQNSRVLCTSCMKHIYDCICDTVQLKR